MVKNWADHCSSDEEDDYTHEVVAAEKPPPEQEQEEAQEAPPKPREPRTYDFPSEPPFTAYIGNLAYSVKHPDRLADEVTGLAKQHLDLDVRVLHARIMMDRNGDKQRHRGFGYVQLETLEQLQGLMKLNEAEGVALEGRRIQLDTANQPRRNSTNSNHRGSADSNIDGSKFRGGRYSKGGSSRELDKNEDGPPAQRVSLKLAPRSKPVQDGEQGSSSSNIFGAGRARDEQSWRDRKVTEGGTERRGSRGGKDNRRASGRGRGGRSNQQREGSKKQVKQQEEKSFRPPPPKNEPVKSVTKVSNAFAALGMSDSDSD